MQMLVHLDRSTPTTLTGLARHLDLAASTVSEAMKALTAHGYVANTRAGRGDRRRAALTLTAKGVAAVRADSVLEPARLGRVLRTLAPAELEAAIGGLSRLARACRERPC
jgi:DNA-binding MarR family transcriptional regulator